MRLSRLLSLKMASSWDSDTVMHRGFLQRRTFTSFSGSYRCFFSTNLPSRMMLTVMLGSM